MNDYYYETKGSKGWFKKPTDRQAIERMKRWRGVKVWRQDHNPDRLVIVLDKKG